MHLLCMVHAEQALRGTVPLLVHGIIKDDMAGAVGLQRKILDKPQHKEPFVWLGGGGKEQHALVGNGKEGIRLLYCGSYVGRCFFAEKTLPQGARLRGSYSGGSCTQDRTTGGGENEALALAEGGGEALLLGGRKA